MYKPLCLPVKVLQKQENAHTFILGKTSTNKILKSPFNPAQTTYPHQPPVQNKLNRGTGTYGGRTCSHSPNNSISTSVSLCGFTRYTGNSVIY